MLGFGFGGLASIIEGNSEAVPGQQGIGVHRAGDSFFQGHDAAEPGDRVVILTLAVLRVGEAGPAPKCVGMLGAEGALASVGCSAKHFLGVAIRALLYQEITNGVLDVGPLSGVALAI